MTADELGGLEALPVQTWHNETPRLGVGRAPRAPGATTCSRLASRPAPRFGVVDALQAAAEWFTLDPGDLVLTGALWPARRLAPGDAVRVAVEPIGLLDLHAAAR